MKPIKIWVDEKSPPCKGWIHIKDFDSFKNLLDTVSIHDISRISFGTELEESDEDYNATDCAVHLIERARGHELPDCVNHTENIDLRLIIDHYVESYKHNSYCGIELNYQN